MADTKKPDTTPEKAKSSGDFVAANRETVESIIVAVILALLFRAFVAEAFVIPTGSMAPTLMGRHVDLWCETCNYHYQTSGSAERTPEDKLTGLLISDSRCPNCGYWNKHDLGYWSNERTMSGDRIIVSKFAYELAEPKRWDVIVFKNPQAAQINFIKRLIGLPGETIKISGGNIYVKAPDEADFKIARKEDDKLLTLLQVVHDADYPSALLEKLDWPAAWQPQTTDRGWTGSDRGKEFSLAASSGDSLLRYRHVFPEPDWSQLNEEKIGDAWRQPRPIEPGWQGGLISDFYAYNCEMIVPAEDTWGWAAIPDPDAAPSFSDRSLSPAFGKFWVDDIALECEVELQEATGEIVLDLVRAGTHYTCRIDAKSSAASLAARSATGEAIPFEDGKTQQERAMGQTSIKGAGTYRLRMSNVDHEVRLWINGWRVQFAGPTTYVSKELVYPDIESVDGDLAPVGVGGANQSLTVRHLKVLRDKYYVGGDDQQSEYQLFPRDSDDRESLQQEIVHMLQYPSQQTLSLLESRRAFEYTLVEDQFMPLGDNSPASSDARFWHDREGRPTPWVGRHLLVGKAVFIYWPHSWNQPPFFPNFRRMQPIR